MHSHTHSHSHECINVYTRIHTPYPDESISGAVGINHLLLGDSRRLVLGDDSALGHDGGARACVCVCVVSVWACVCMREGESV
jgi:hypothetical protein